MCGLAGYIIKNNNIETNNTNILSMLKLQKHRGPDDSGIVAINSKLKTFEEVSINEQVLLKNKSNIVLGFNRLSILDLSPNGHQPMLSNNNQVALMLNGEIYNAFDFKSDLQAKGCVFKSNTDTEIVLNLYLVYGMDEMLKKLNGMFAICIWDFNLNKLFLARDRFGIKPLYVLEENERIAFSSEMKSFKALNDFKFELNKAHLHEFLLFRNLVNNTLFKNIRNLTPGTYLEINDEGLVKEIEFYNLKIEEKKFNSQSDTPDLIKTTLKKSVERQMLSDVKLGCQLSGGIDSSLVTVLANEFNNQNKLETISIVFKNKLFSEEDYINQVASKFNLNAHKYCLKEDYYFNMIEKVTWHFEQPINHPNSIGLYLLSENAKKYVTVLLSGEGADEILGGYSRFIDYYRNPFFNKSFLSKLFFNRKSLCSFIIKYFNWKNRLILASTFSSLNTLESVLPNFNFKKATNNRKKILNNIATCSKNNIHRHYEMATYLPDLLMRQDKMSMAHSIENRVPFLDNEFVSLALSIENSKLITKYKGKFETKFLLKKLCASILGENFAFREKKGFGIPLKEFMSSESFDKLWNLKIRPGIVQRNIFNIESIDLWVKNIKKARLDELEAIWQMLTFELWAQQYLD